jgi:hypothetical protein
MVGSHLLKVLLPLVGDQGPVGVRDDDGRTYARTPVKMFLHDRHVLIIDPATGLILRDFILDPTRDYQPRSLDQHPETEKHPGP